MTENKGYKFKIEFTETDYYDEDQEKYDMKFTAYCDSAKETVSRMDELKEEYHKFVKKWGDKNMKAINNKDNLK